MKLRNFWIIFVVIVLLIIGAILYFKIFYKSGEGPAPIQTNFTFCDADTPCPSKSHTCIKLPENEFPTCEYFLIRENYPCPDGTQIIIAESYPPKLFCVENNLNNYTCPEEKSINCMPIIDPKSPFAKYCDSPYSGWIKENCDVEFVY